MAVHGKWSEWEEWGACGKTCGKGTQSRVRQCDDPAPANDGLKCVGGERDTRECEVISCPSKFRIDAVCFLVVVISILYPSLKLLYKLCGMWI